MSHCLRMFINPAVRIYVLTLTLITAFSTLGLTSPLAMTAVAASGGAGKALPTLDGKPPLLIGHRGASGYLPDDCTPRPKPDHQHRRGLKTRIR